MSVDELIELRTRLERGCCNSSDWRTLGDEFASAGMDSNAARCWARAEHYAERNDIRVEPPFAAPVGRNSQC